MSPQQCQHIARLAMLDIESDCDVRLLHMLRGLGGAGSSSNNSHRDMLRRLPKTNMPSTYMFSVPLLHSVFREADGNLGIT